MAKAFLSIPHDAIHRMGRPVNISNALGTIYNNTETSCYVGGKRIKYAPKRGVKEGCPCSPLLFLIVYNLLINTITKDITYVDDVAVVLKDAEGLKRMTTLLDKWVHILGIKFNAEKTESYDWQTAKEKTRHGTTTWNWKGTEVTCPEPILNYLDHMVACSGYKVKARKNLEERMRADTKLYSDIPLNPLERAQIVADVLLPRWRYRSVLL